ncbi:hypothetical protein Tco_1523315 [Tanacetum coccineum]
MVLDDSCVVSRDLGNYVMGEVKQFSSINTLHVILSNEGFPNAKVVYLGGLWVMIELTSSKSKAKFLKHVGVASWFNCLSNAQSDFVSRDRIVWVDIEGVPMHVWSSTTFHKIGSKWGEVLDHEELGVKQSEFCKQGNSEDESDNEAVSDTFYGENTNEEGYVAESVPQSIEKEISNDPFKIYDLLNKRKEAVEQEQSHSKSIGSSSRIMESAQKIDKHLPSEAYGNGLKHREGGSILEVLEEMIKRSGYQQKDIKIEAK